MPYLERHDAGLRDIVQRGLVLDAERGTLKAWIFMKEHGVSDTVMLRVLTRPDQRRLSDTSALRSARSDGLLLKPRSGLTLRHELNNIRRVQAEFVSICQT